MLIIDVFLEIPQKCGMEGPWQFQQDSVWRQRYNGKDIVDEKEVRWHDYGARWYDPVIGRFGQVDPAATTYPFQSTYAYIHNNPIRFRDFMGLGNEADFYNEKGKYLGTDGIEDGRNIVVTDRKEARSIKKTDKRGGTTSIESVNSGVELPNASVRTEMGKAVERAGSPSFHEEGGFFGESNGKEFVVHAEPGKTADPSIDDHASINVMKAADPSTLPNDPNPKLKGTFHTHPNGTKTVGNTKHYFQNSPSDTDINNAGKRGIRGFVLSQGNNTVYIYDGSGVLATFPVQKFINIGN